jgi:uncharacterized protein involved in exopolysaccharide biosynthesis
MEDEINLLDYWRILMRRKKLIMLIVVCATVISIVYSLLATKIYRAETSILPIGGDSTGGLGALIAQTGVGSLLGAIGSSTPSASLMAVLRSRSVAERIIDRFSLMQVFYEDEWDAENGAWKETDPKDIPQMEDAVKDLHEVMTFTEDMEMSLIEISGEFEDPELAANVMNAYIEELSKFLSENELTSEKRNRIFVEGQLEKNKVVLLETGKELSQFYGNNEISNSDPRLDVNVSINNVNIETSSISDKQIELLKTKKGQLEQKIRQARLVKDVPQQIYLEYLTGYYQLLGQINALLTQEYDCYHILCSFLFYGDLHCVLSGIFEGSGES